jgi:outer membrane protein assembly factor BamA
MYATTYNVPFKTIGFEVEASADWVFGSRNYIDSQFEYRQYIPLSLNDIIAMKYGFGIAFDPNDEFDFVVGSNRTVRGYIPKYGKAGDIYALGSLEYRRFIKQPPKAFEIALFTDVGTAIDGVSDLALKNILVSVGFGLRFYVPFFDLMKIDIALPVNSARVFPRLIFGFREEF